MSVRPLRYPREYGGQFFAVTRGRSTYLTNEGTWMVAKRKGSWRVAINMCHTDIDVRLHAVCIHAGIYENEFLTRKAAVEALETIVTAGEVKP